MPHIPVHPSAIKRHRQNLKRRARNRTVRGRVHSVVKGVVEALSSNDSNATREALKLAAKVLHKAASKGTLHRNTVSRKLGRLAARVHREQAHARAQT